MKPTILESMDHMATYQLECSKSHLVASKERDELKQRLSELENIMRNVILGYMFGGFGGRGHA